MIDKYQKDKSAEKETEIPLEEQDCLHVMNSYGDIDQIGSALKRQVEETNEWWNQNTGGRGCTIQNVCRSLFRQVERNYKAAEPSKDLKYNGEILTMALDVNDSHYVDISGALNLPPLDYVKACYMMILNRVPDDLAPWEDLIKSTDEAIVKKEITKRIIRSVEAMVHDVHLINDPYGIQPTSAEYLMFRFARKFVWLKRFVKRR